MLRKEGLLPYLVLPHMATVAERHRELVVRLQTHANRRLPRSGLADVGSLTGLPTADQAGALPDQFEVCLVSLAGGPFLLSWWVL